MNIVIGQGDFRVALTEKGLKVTRGELSPDGEQLEVTFTPRAALYLIGSALSLQAVRLSDVIDAYLELSDAPSHESVRPVLSDLTELYRKRAGEMEVVLDSLGRSEHDSGESERDSSDT